MLLSPESHFNIKTLIWVKAATEVNTNGFKRSVPLQIAGHKFKESDASYALFSVMGYKGHTESEHMIPNFKKNIT